MPMGNNFNKMLKNNKKLIYTKIIQLKLSLIGFLDKYSLFWIYAEGGFSDVNGVPFAELMVTGNSGFIDFGSVSAA